MKQIIKHIMLLLLPSWGIAQDSLPVLQLDSILSRIDKQNITLQAYGLQAESYRYRADAASGWMAPMVGAGTFMTPYSQRKVMGDGDKGNLMFQVEQDIPNPAKINAKKKYISSQANIVSGDRNIALNNLRALAREQYYLWLIAKNKISLLHENERLMNTMKKIEEVRYPYNRSNLSGIYTITAKLEENKNMLVMQEGVIQRARATLLGLMNEEENLQFDIDTAADVHYVPPQVEDTSEIAASRKDISQMNERIRSMQLNISSMQMERKPDFRIRFDHMVPLGRTMPSAYSIMGMISIPIAPWASKMYKSEVKAMEYSIKSMEKERQGMLQETKGMLNGMQREIVSMHERVISTEDKIIPALKKALDANYLLYQENKISLREVLDSWEALNMMQMNLLDEKLEHFEMIVAYEKELYR